MEYTVPYTGHALDPRNPGLTKDQERQELFNDTLMAASHDIKKLGCYEYKNFHLWQVEDLLDEVENYPNDWSGFDTSKCQCSKFVLLDYNSNLEINFDSIEYAVRFVLEENI